MPGRANLFHGRVLAIRMYVDARVIFLSGFGLVCLCNRCFQCILGRMLVYSIHSTSSGTLWRGVLRFRPCKSHQCTCYRVKLAPGRVLAIRSYVDALARLWPGNDIIWCAVFFVGRSWSSFSGYSCGAYVEHLNAVWLL